MSPVDRRSIPGSFNPGVMNLALFLSPASGGQKSRPDLLIVKTCHPHVHLNSLSHLAPPPPSTELGSTLTLQRCEVTNAKRSQEHLQTQQALFLCPTWKQQPIHRVCCVAFSAHICGRIMPLFKPNTVFKPPAIRKQRGGNSITYFWGIFFFSLFIQMVIIAGYHLLLFMHTFHL